MTECDLAAKIPRDKIKAYIDAHYQAVDMCGTDFLVNGIVDIIATEMLGTEGAVCQIRQTS